MWGWCCWGWGEGRDAFVDDGGGGGGGGGLGTTDPEQDPGRGRRDRLPLGVVVHRSSWVHGTRGVLLLLQVFSTETAAREGRGDGGGRYE